MTSIFVSFLLFLSCSGNHNIRPASFQGRVVAIKDGDTFKIMHNGKAETIRLLHIDSPEKKQPFGAKAKQHVSSLCFGKNVTVVMGGRDRYGRLLGEVFVGEVCVNKKMVEAGMAWHFKKYSNSAEYALIENRARKAKVGLWSEKNPVSPWEWRKARRTAKMAY